MTRDIAVDRFLIPFRTQLAVLGSSGDLATDSELELAAHLGVCAARKGVTVAVGGDDGVMGSAARAAKFAGGSVIALLPRNKKLSDGSVFDFVVQTSLAWVQFSEVLLGSCGGAIVIGGGAGTLGELSILYIHQRPAAFLGSSSELARRYAGRSLDRRNLTTFPCFDNAESALESVLSQIWKEADPEHLKQEAEGLHYSSYPFGTAGEYLRAAKLSQAARFAFSAHHQDTEATRAAALESDCRGDHEYYHTEDFFGAASHYAAALGFVQSSSPTGEETKDHNSLRAYLRAMLVECLALGFREVGDLEMASELSARAAERYRAAITGPEEDEHRFLRHSAVGLDALADSMRAKTALLEGESKEASRLASRALRLCEESSEHHPLWRSAGFSDSYKEFRNELEELLKAAKAQGEARWIVPRVKLSGGRIPRLFLGDHGFLELYGSKLSTTEIQAAMAEAVSSATIGLCAGDERCLRAAAEVRNSFLRLGRTPLFFHTDIPMMSDSGPMRFDRAMSTLKQFLAEFATSFLESDPIVGEFLVRSGTADPYSRAELQAFRLDELRTENLVAIIEEFSPDIVSIGGDYLEALLTVGLSQGVEVFFRRLAAARRHSPPILAFTTYVGPIVPSDVVHEVLSCSSAIMVPVNHSGFGMAPSREAMLGFARRSGLPLVAMHALGGGRIDPKAALSFALNEAGASIAVVGASTSEHIQRLIVGARTVLGSG